MFASLRSKLFASYTFLVVLSLLLVGLSAGLLISTYQKRAQVSALHSQAVMIRTLIEQQVTVTANGNMTGTLKQMAMKQLGNDVRQATTTAKVRLLLVGSNGKVVEDTTVDVGENLEGKNFEPQPHSIMSGLPNRRANAAADMSIYATTADDKSMYVTAEFAPRYFGRLQYLVVMAQPVNAWAAVLFPLFLVGLIALLLSLLVAWLLGRNISQPIQRISLAASRIAKGDYSQRIIVQGEDEVAMLGHDFNVMADEVQRTQQAQRDFLANISHDLKTPLTSIQGFSQAILDGTLPDITSAQGAARVINDESLRMGRLVTALLELSRLQSGQVQMKPQPLDLGQMLRATVDGLQPQAAVSDLSLGQRGLDDLPTVMGDPDRLRQVFTNLVDNAIKHTPAGGWVQVEAIVQPTANPPSQRSIIVSVADSGEGIPAADLPRIFERFYQVEKSRASDGRGLGLGLAISKEIIEAHGGTIAAESEVGRGTSFTVTLPTIASLNQPPTLQLRPSAVKRVS